MRINKISQLHYGVFHGFKWPDALENFGKYNLIYGWNGSGKTTISQIFRALEKGEQFPGPKDPQDAEVTLTINDEEVSGHDFPNQPVSVRVFNRDFIEKNVFRTDDIDPIFILGEPNIERENELKKLKEKREKTQKSLQKEQAKTKTAERNFEKHCSEQARLIKELLGSAGSAKENPYNNYDKGNYKERAEKMLKEGDVEKYRLNDGDREKYKQRTIDTSKSHIKEREYRVPDLKLLASDVSALLDETVAKAIQSLKGDPDLSNWVSKGFKLHRDRDTTECLYCEQEIPAKRLASLEQHFDDSYEQFVGKLDEKGEEVRELRRLSKGVLSSLPDEARFYDDLVEEYEDARSGLEETLAKIKKFLKSLDEKLQEKKRNPFAKVSMNEPRPAISNDVLGKLKSVIAEHNDRVDNSQSTKEKARERLEKDWVADNLEEYRDLKNKIQKHDELYEEWKEKKRV